MSDDRVDIHLRALADGVKQGVAEAKDTIRDLKDDVVRRGAEMAGVSADLASGVAKIAPAFLAVGAAAYATWRAFADGRAEIREMNLAIAKTGEFSGQSAASLRALAGEMAAASTLTVGEAKTIATALAASGQVGSAAFRSVSLVAGDFARVMGTDVARIAPELVKLFDDPARGAAELNRTMHFLSAAELDHIEHLHRMGEATQAQAVFAEKFADRLGKIKPELSALASAWNAVEQAASRAWNTMKGKLAAAETDQDRLAVALQQAQDGAGGIMGGVGRTAMQRALALERQINADAARRMEAADAAEQNSREQRARELNASTVGARVRKIDEEIAFLQRYGQNVAFTAEKLKDLNAQRERLLAPRAGKAAAEPIDVFGDRSFITGDKATAKSIADSYAFENWAYGELNRDKARAAAEAESRRMAAGRITHGLEADYRQTAETRSRAADAERMTESHKRLAAALYEVDSKARHAREALDLKFTARAKESQEYRDAVAAIDGAQSDAAESARRWAEDQDRLNASWETGAVRGLRAYADEAARTADRVAGSFRRGAQMAEDAIANFVVKGKLDIRSLAEFAAVELARENVARPLVSAGAGWLRGLLAAGAGGSGSMAFGAAGEAGTLLGFAGGGYTGDGARVGGIDGQGGFLAMLHPRETVVDHAGDGASGGGTVRIEVVNQGTPQKVVSSQAAFDAKGAFVRLFLADLRDNGPMRQAMTGAFGLRG